MIKFIPLSYKISSISGVTISLPSLKAFIIEIPTVRNLHVRKLIAEKFSNRFRVERVMYFGPELACLEWLMECGSPEVIMSDGTSITCRSQMRRYISDFGFKFRSIPTPTTPFKWSPVLPTISMKKLNAIYDMRWAKKPNVYIAKVDGSDSAIADSGFQYFKECRQIEVLKLNFCDFFTNKAIEHLVSGRPARTLLNIEIVANPYISDDFIKGIKRIRGLQRVHFYFLPNVEKQALAVQSLKTSLPCCRVSFPELKEVGYGYGCNVENSSVKKMYGTEVKQRLKEDNKLT